MTFVRDVASVAKRLGNRLAAGRVIAFCVVFAATSPIFAGERKSPADLAREFDATLRSELGLTDEDLVPLASDETLVRRYWLDAFGYPPTAYETLAFIRSAPQTNPEIFVAQLVRQPDFGVNFGRYWRDVLRGRLDELPPDREMIERFAIELNRGSSWDRIATSVIAAERRDRELFVHYDPANPGVAASEVSRIFLGISIECAECHDHPTDPWKQEQFEEFAAFFEHALEKPDARSLRKKEETSMSFEATTPRFYLDGFATTAREDDVARRRKLAQRIVSPQQPWFARAFVNRVCTELLGDGFYERVDDIGPGRECHAPRTLALLCDDFVASGYDIRRLYEAIMLSDTYRRECRAPEDRTVKRFACNRVQPLRGDQFFDSMIRALGLPAAAREDRETLRSYADARQRTPRDVVVRTFGFDASAPRKDVHLGLPQALAMMNVELVEKSIVSYREEGPGTWIERIADDRILTETLYLHVLSRRPTEREFDIVAEYVEEAPLREIGYEDLLWALINSAEFSHRR